MPNLFRTTGGAERKPGIPLLFQRADGTIEEGIWAGSATAEKLSWWLGKPGHVLTQTEPVSAIAVKADDDGEIIWGDAPPGARLLFILEPPAPGKSYRLAKMVTTAATSAQIAFFRHERSALFGTLDAGGHLHRIPPLLPPPPSKVAQGFLF